MVANLINKLKQTKAFTVSSTTGFNTHKGWNLTLPILRNTARTTKVRSHIEF